MASPISPLKRNQLIALLAAAVILEEGVVNSVTNSFWETIGWIGGSIEWLVFCLYLLPVLLMAPVSIWADKQVGRERMIAWGLCLVGGSMPVMHVAPVLGVLGLAVGNAFFIPSAFLSLASLLFERNGRTDLGFTLAWIATWVGMVFVEPLLVELGGGILTRLLLMALLVGAGLLLWFNRVGLRGAEPPAVPKANGKKTPQGLQILFAGAAGWGIWLVLQIIRSAFDLEIHEGTILMGLVATGMFLYWNQKRGGRPLWFQLGAVFLILFSVLQSSVFAYSSTIGYELIYDTQYLEWALFPRLYLPFLLGMGLIVALVRWMPEHLRGQGNFLFRLLASVLVLGLLVWIVSGNGWLPPHWMVLFLQGIALTMSIPLAMMFFWQHAPVGFKTVSVGLGFLLLGFGNAGQASLVDLFDQGGMNEAEAFQSLNAFAAVAALLMAGLMVVIWLRKRQV